MRCLLPALMAGILLPACSLTATPSAAPSSTPAPTHTIRPSSTQTLTPTETQTPTITLTPTLTLKPTASATPTIAFPAAIANKQAHCRYGPSVAYLHAADLYAGDKGAVRARHPYSTWLYIKFDKLGYYCWAAPSVIDVTGDVPVLPTREPNLVSIGSSLYPPPQNVTAVRKGAGVTISWDQVRMSRDQDRGYFIEAFVCQNGLYLWWTFSYPDQFTTSYTVRDEAGCPEPSYGQIYTVTKEGYSKPKDIPWPPP